MYKIFTGILFLLGSIAPAGAQTNETEVDSKVEEVIVFRAGAQEYRSAKTSINEGTSILKFTNLPNTVNPNSIQIKGVEKFTILSIGFRINYMSSTVVSAELQKLNDSIEMAQNKLNYVRKKIFVLEQEKKLFTDNKNMVGKDSGLDAEELEEMLILYGKRLIEIEGEIIDRKNEEYRLTERYNNTYAQYSAYYNSNSKASGEILVTVNSKSKISSTDILLSFYLSAAGWNPHYDIRAKDTKSEIEIDYQSNVFQSSGSDWNNVKLTLSSSSPNFSNTLPELANWYLQFGQNYYPAGNQSNVTGWNWDYDGKMDGGYASTSSSRQSTSIEFVIDKPYTIPTDGKEYKVDIGKFKVPATYSYFAVPKMEESAFILARLTGWYDLNLLAGSTKIYFGNSYVGDSYLNPEVVEDTLDISLGNDEAIIVQRLNVSDMNAKNVTGNTKKKTEEFEISIRNNRSNDIRIKILDQVPVSTDKEVIVTADSYEGAAYNKENGELSWLLEVKTGETKKVRMKYTVKYPKNKIISNL